MAIPTRENTSSEVLAQMDEFGFDDGSDNKIGDLSDSGLSFSVSTNEIQIASGSQIEIYAYAKGATDMNMSGELLNINVNNMAFALGLDEDAANIGGAGTSGDPYELTVDPEKIGEQAARTYYGLGTRVDADIVRFEASTARVFAPDFELTMTQGEAALIPFTLRITGTWKVQRWTP